MLTEQFIERLRVMQIAPGATQDGRFRSGCGMV